MRRRTLLAAGCALVASAAGCTAAKQTPAPGSTDGSAGGTAGSPAPGPTGGQATASPGAAPAAVASWQLTGGFVGPGVAGIRPPRLSVYADRRAIADARYAGEVTAAELADLVDRLVHDLRDPTVDDRRPGAPAVADAPDTVLIVRSAAGDFTATAAGLEELRDQNAYRAELYDARDRLDAVYKRVVDGRKPYAPDRVRLVALPVQPGVEMEAVRPWPQAVAVPPGEGANTRSANLSGGAARGVVALFDPEWRTYRTANGLLLSATWRYLLPDE